MLPCRNVGIIHSDQHTKDSSKHPKYRKRSEIVMNLIEAYGFLNYLTVYPAIIHKNRLESFLETLTTFHSYDYLMAIKKLSIEFHKDENMLESVSDFEKFGLVYDCCGFEGLMEFSLSSVAGTMVAAQAIVTNRSQICINWYGGWHHAKREEAGGFCYLNDIVYGIMTLMNRFNRILYIDIDLHHGDGVEEAFYHTSRVFTISIHYSSPGFYPSMKSKEGSDLSTGYGDGRHSAARFAFTQEGISDEIYCYVFDSLLEAIVPVFKPEVIVIQCGTDGLCSDPHKVLNLSHRTYEHVISQLLKINVPMLILGGGGYNYPDTAKIWTRITATLLGHCVPEDIPDHDNMALYGPCFESTIQISNWCIKPNMSKIQIEIDKINRQMLAFQQFRSLKDLLV